MKTVDEIMHTAFTANQTRDPTSNEYKEGTRAALEYRINGKQMHCPYQLGTAAADAWFSGTNEGHRHWRTILESDTLDQTTRKS